MCSWVGEAGQAQETGGQELSRQRWLCVNASTGDRAGSTAMRVAVQFLLYGC